MLIYNSQGRTQDFCSGGFFLGGTKNFKKHIKKGSGYSIPQDYSEYFWSTLLF